MEPITIQDNEEDDESRQAGSSRVGASPPVVGTTTSGGGPRAAQQRQQQQHWGEALEVTEQDEEEPTRRDVPESARAAESGQDTAGDRAQGEGIDESVRNDFDELE